MAQQPVTRKPSWSTLSAAKAWVADWADFRPLIAVPVPSARHWDREGGWVADPVRAPSNPAEAKVQSSPPPVTKTLEEVKLVMEAARNAKKKGKYQLHSSKMVLEPIKNFEKGKASINE